MTFAAAVKDIETRLSNNWGTTVLDINPNVDFPVPADYSESYVKLRVFNDSTNRINVGMPGKHRTRGSILVQIFTPLNKGTRLGLSYGDDIADIFREAKFGTSNIVCREAHVEEVGEFNGRWQTDVIIPFYWDATKS